MVQNSPFTCMSLSVLSFASDRKGFVPTLNLTVITSFN